MRWQTLYLRPVDTSRLLELARDEVPRFGAKVETLVLAWWTHDELRRLSKAKRTSDLDDTLEAAERFTGLQTPDTGRRDRVLHLHDALIAATVRACPNLLHLKLVVQLPPLDGLDLEFRELLYHARLTKDALCGLGNQLVSVNFSFEGSYPNRALVETASYLAYPTNIERLSLRLKLLDYESSIPPQFPPAISRLRNLGSLDLHTATPDLWTRLERELPNLLSDLALSGLELDLSHFGNVLKSRHIASLCLGIPLFEPYLRISPPADLEVENLSISGLAATQVLDFFNCAPLKTVEFCARRGRASGRISGKRVKVLAEEHSGTLNSLKVDRFLFDPSTDVSAINHSLEQQGISVRVVTVG